MITRYCVVRKEKDGWLEALRNLLVGSSTKYVFTVLPKIHNVY